MRIVRVVEGNANTRVIKSKSTGSPTSGYKYYLDKKIYNILY